MAKKLYVGGLPYKTDEKSLGDIFAKYGSVLSTQVIKDKMTGKSRGFGFVEMEDDAADQATKSSEEGGMNGAMYETRRLTVNEARPMEQRAPRRDFGNRGSNANDWRMAA